MIELNDVGKIYYRRRFFRKPVQTVGVENLNLKIGPGCFGLLGINGAGKTTTLKMIATLLLPTSGRITINGLDVRTNEKMLRGRINMITGSDRMLYFRLTGRENLLYFASLYGMNRRDAAVRSSELLELTGLTGSADMRVESYSRGMKQRLSIARGLINDPQILLLDEPTLGLDVSIASGIRSFIKDVLLDRADRTIILTSHYMNEIEDICSEIGILQSGRLIYRGDFAGLYELMDMEEVHQFTIPGQYDAMRSKIEAMIPGVPEWRSGSGGEIVCRMSSADGYSFLKQMDSLGIRGLCYSQEKPGLEEAVMKLNTAGGKV